MTTYFLFGKYCVDSLKKANSKRTAQAYKLIQKLGGKIKSVHALLGENDIIIQAELPGTKAALKASLGLTRLTGIGFTTSEAVPVSEFDKIVK